MYGLNKYMIDINIETLAGTTFSLKVSPLEPIQSVKAKIQRLEGIPISHQHLVWKTTELDDSSCLNDYNITNGATIKMVLALRGGPINTRRMTTEDSLLRDVSDLMEIREDSNLWNNNDSSQSMNKHVTLLLFRDGDHLNLLRVIDRGDATSPISGAMSAASMYVPYDEIDHERLLTTNQEELNKNEAIETDLTNKISKISKSKNKKSLTNENEKTREKMIALRNKMNEYKKSKAKKKLQSTESSQSTTANNNLLQDKSNEESSNLINKKSPNDLVTSTEEQQQTATTPIIMQPPSTSATTKLNQIKATNNLRMKRFQILGDSKIIQNEILSTTPKKMGSSTTTVQQITQATNDSAKIINSSEKSSKTKLTTIYTTTDRNGQVFIKRIHENYNEYDDEDDEESEEGGGVDDDEDDDDDDENYDDEDSEVDDEEDEENYEEECPDYENNLLKNYNCYYDDEYFVDDDEDDSEDDEDDEEEDNDNDDEEDDEEDDEDDIDDDIDDEEIDDENEQKNCIVFHSNQSKNYPIKIKNNSSQLDINTTKTQQQQQESEYDNTDGVTMYGEEEENYDEDEHELLLNKSELLIAEDRQINNSPNSGVGNSNGGNRSTDLMTMMMMMSLNGDTTGIANGISSSLATTALPTIITPMYTTDNENFVLPPTRSAIKKLKSIRGSKKNSQNYSNQLKLHKSRKMKSLNKINNILDVIQIETKNQIAATVGPTSSIAAAEQTSKQNFEEMDKLKQIENIILEEKLKRQILKQKRKKRQLQNQAVESLNQQDKKIQDIENVENQQLSKEQQQQQSENEEQLIARKNTNRRRRRREYQIEQHTQPNISFSSILLLPEEIENLKKRVKEGNAIKQNRQIRNQANLKIINDKQLILDNEQMNNSKNPENKNEQIINETNNNNNNNKNQADESFVNEMKSETNENKVIINNNMPSNLQKRVSFIVTPNDDEKNSNETNENIINTTTNNNNNNNKVTNPIIENNYYNIEKMKKILKLSNNSPNRNNALQAKVYKTYETENSVQPVKPLLLTNYKQKPPPKLDSLYSSNEIVANVNKTSLYSNQQQEIIQEQNYSTRVTVNNEHDYNNENRTKLIKNPYNTINEITQQNRVAQQQPNLLMKRNSSALRNVSTPTSSPTTSNNLNRIDILKTSSSYAGNPAVKTYSNPLAYSSNVRINSKTNLINDTSPPATTTTTTIEPLRLYSASSRNKSISISSNLNDINQSKSLKLPPVINTNNSTSSNNNGANFIIGGSTNNLTSMGLSETSNKKKINDLSRYCYFCQRKTGLVSSYICRCGNNYCTQHRNAEAHNCTYDYKTEGRKLIEHANPLVAAPKLPKI